MQLGARIAARPAGQRAAAGFRPGDGPSVVADPVRLPSEGHVMTVAPTGSGKSVSCAMPVLLQHEGPAVVLDLRGELYAVTARRRREMGQRVVVIDPEGVTDAAPSGFNPLDLIEPDTAAAFPDARFVAETLMPAAYDARDVFWRKRGEYLLAATILDATLGRLAGGRTLTAVRDELYRMAAGVAERGDGREGRRRRIPDRELHPAVARAKEVLGMGSASTVGGMLHTALEGVGFLEGPGLEHSVGSSGFTLDEVTEGAPMTIYLVLPPHLLGPLDTLVRLWFGVIFAAIARRRSRPPLPTLMLIDEAAQLGPFAPLRQAITLMRGYGCQTWTFWQDPAQLQQTYPRDWRSLVNNCRTLQGFGALNEAARAQLSECLGCEPHLLAAMGSDEMVLGHDGVFEVARRLDYRADPDLCDHADPNPIYDGLKGPHRRPPVPHLGAAPERSNKTPFAAVHGLLAAAHRDPSSRSRGSRPRARSPLDFGSSDAAPIPAPGDADFPWEITSGSGMVNPDERQR